MLLLNYFLMVFFYYWNMLCAQKLTDMPVVAECSVLSLQGL